MAIVVVWVDQEHAKIFHISPEKMERKEMRARHHEHHTQPNDALVRQSRETHFFSELTQQIPPEARILLLGPGVAKHHVLNYWTEHFPAIGKRVVGCETVDHPTDGEIVALARKFFRLPATSETA